MFDKKYVYKLTFPNGKAYFGVTRDIYNRWGNNGNQYRGQKVFEHIREYGWNNIKKEILYEGDGSVACNNRVLRIERALIELWGEDCYNESANPTVPISDGRAYRKGTGIWWTIDGVSKPATDWCKDYKKKYSAVLSRIKKHGLTPIQALTYPNVPSTRTRFAREYWLSLGLSVPQNLV